MGLRVKVLGCCRASRPHRRCSAPPHAAPSPSWIPTRSGFSRGTGAAPTAGPPSPSPPSLCVHLRAAIAPHPNKSMLCPWGPRPSHLGMGQTRGHEADRHVDSDGGSDTWTQGWVSVGRCSVGAPKTGLVGTKRPRAPLCCRRGHRPSSHWDRAPIPRLHAHPMGASHRRSPCTAHASPRGATNPPVPE